MTKKFRDTITAEIRLDSFLEGLKGMVHFQIELLAMDKESSEISSHDITSRVLIVQGNRYQVSAEVCGTSMNHI